MPLILCAGRNETFSFATPIGVGLIESAINLSKLCLQDKPSEIIFIGSAGSYGEYEIFDILESSSSSNIELSFLNDDSYTPLNKIIKSTTSTLNDKTIVNSSNYITTNEILSNGFKEYGIGIENMEFFSLVSVANEFEIPIKGIFIVTNYTNKNAHKDFIKNHNIAMNKLTNYLEEKKILEI